MLYHYSRNKGSVSYHGNMCDSIAIKCSTENSDVVISPRKSKFWWLHDASTMYDQNTLDVSKKGILRMKHNAVLA